VNSFAMEDREEMSGSKYFCPREEFEIDKFLAAERLLMTCARREQGAARAAYGRDEHFWRMYAAYTEWFERTVGVVESDFEVSLRPSRIMLGRMIPLVITLAAVGFYLWSSLCA